MPKHEILISEPIGETIFGMDLGVTARSIHREIESAGDSDILVRINSPGGSVFEAAAIFNILRDRGVDISIDGLAASAATVIAMSGNHIRMAENSMFVIHNPHGFAAGDSAEMRHLADVLDKVKGTIIDTYHGRTGLEKNRLDQMMAEDTWLNATEAKKMGFVDEIGGKVKIENRFDLEQFGFKNKPKDWPPEPPARPKLEAALAKFAEMSGEEVFREKMSGGESDFRKLKGAVK